MLSNLPAIKNLFGAFALLCLFPWMGKAQSPLAEIKKTADYYKSLNGFSVNVAVSFYTTETSSDPAKVLKGSTQIKGNLSHSNFDGRESIMGTDFILVADHPNQSVYYSPREKQQKNGVSNGSEVLDSSFIANYSVSFSVGEGNLNVYKLTPKKTGTEFKSITLKINPATQVLTEIVYVYNGNVKYKKTLIRYSNFNSAWEGGKTYFTETKFIIGRQKQARLTAAYSAYKLINSFNYDPKKNLIE